MSEPEQNQQQTSNKRKNLLPWLVVLILVLLVAAGGIYSFVISKNVASMAQANQRGQFQQNPALQAAMGLMRLQQDSSVTLTSEQISKLKPILQTLIATTNPSQDFLQQQAAAITNLLTDQQKSALTAGRNNFTGQNPNPGNGNQPGPGGAPNGGNGGGPGQGVGGNTASGGGQNGRGAGTPPQAKAMYQRVLDSLTN